MQTIVEDKKPRAGDKEEVATGNNGVNSIFEPEEKRKNGREGIKKEALADTAKIKIRNFKISSEGKDLSINASLIIANGKRYGLVGFDIYGKSAFLNYLADGALYIPSDMDVLYWKPDIVDEKQTVIKAVLKPTIKCAELLKERVKLKAEQEKLKVKQKKGNREKEIKERLTQLWEELLMIDPEGTPALSKAGRILCSLGFSFQNIDRTIKDIPQHLKKRVSLARALFLEPTLLILDEPTSILDLDAILWLENYLQDWTKTLIVVSQDRCFLDKVCNEILHFNQQKILCHKGNFSCFEKMISHKQRKKLKKTGEKLQLEVNGESRDAGVKTQNGALSRNQSQNEVKKNNSEEGGAPVKLLQKPEFSFLDPVDFKRKDFVQLLGITFGYEAENPMFDYLANAISYRSRVAFLGPSRAGKSTLLRLASSQLIPLEGRVHIKPGAKIGWFSENSIDKLPAKKTPLEYIYEKALGQTALKGTALRQKVVEQLNRLGLVDHSHITKIEDLSDNEKARVALAELCFIPHDGLLLDEPTRHLDIDMIDALVDAINRFKGGLWMATNNEYLIRETECNLCVIEDRQLGYVIDFDDYRKKLLTKLNEPIRGPFVYKKKPSLKRDLSPIKVVSDSMIIENYIKSHGNVDPSIKEIGKYRIILKEGTREWTCYSPTLHRCRSAGKSKDLCIKSMYEAIESYIEYLIKIQEVPPPP